MYKNRLTIWFLSGFLIYGALALLVGIFAGIGGAFGFAIFCVVGAAICGLKLALDKM